MQSYRTLCQIARSDTAVAIHNYPFDLAVKVRFSGNLLRHAIASSCSSQAVGATFKDVGDAQTYGSYGHVFGLIVLCLAMERHKMVVECQIMLGQ